MIEIEDLHKSFGEKKVLTGVNLKIPDGETLAIIGKSGCGKSVLLKHVVGLLTPDRGRAVVDGKVIAELSEKDLFALRARMGYVFQGAALFDSLTVFENVTLGLYERGVRDLKTLTEEAFRTLTAVGLLPQDRDSAEFEREWKILKDKMPSDLSGGMKKRVGVARALVGEPDYVFYDEPTTGLDPVNSEQIDNLIYELTSTLKSTSVVITHDMFSVDRVADKVAMLYDGEVRFFGGVSEMKTSDDPIVSEFLARYG